MEEAFESIINMTKFQLENNVYPEFDPVYRMDPSGKGKCLHLFLVYMSHDHAVQYITLTITCICIMLYYQLIQYRKWLAAKT